MPLQFPGSWRFTPPPGSKPIPQEAVVEFYQLVGKVVVQGKRWSNLEHFKRFFGGAIGSMSFTSSSESWADTDLQNSMSAAAENPPVFLEALFDGFKTIEETQNLHIPDIGIINDICRRHQVGFELHPPQIVQSAEGSQSIPVPAPPPTLEEEAILLLQESYARSEQLLVENRPREAVQEMLWVIESLVTGFKGIPIPSGQVKGKYFNQIAGELKKTTTENTFRRAIDWCEQIHGYLSSPSGGGVRHGIDLNSGQPLSQNEGRLFCNLIRSFVTYLQLEHQRLESS